MLLIRSLSISMLLCLDLLSLAQEKSEFEKLALWPSDGVLREAQKGKYVFRDAATEEVVIVIPPDRGDPRSRQSIVRYRPQNQVEPDISVAISEMNDGRLQYRYTIANGQRARQSIDSLFLAVPSEGEIDVGHPAWGKIRMPTTVFRQLMNPSIPEGGSLYWNRSSANGLAAAIDPGQRLEGFSATTDLLPGLATAYVQGGPPLATPREVSVEAGPHIVLLLKEARRIVTTIGPRFTRETTKQSIAADYQEGMKYLAEQKVLDRNAPFYAETMGILRACAGSRPCPIREGARKLQGLSSSSLENAIAVGLLHAFSPRQ